MGLDKRFIRRLVTTIKCGVCGRLYDGDNIDILGHRDDLWFLSLYCPHCRSQGLMAAMIEGDWSGDLVTDLAEGDAIMLRGVARVDTDDVLDIHNFLKGFDGGFASLFYNN